MFATTGNPFGAMTVLSLSTVAMSMRNPLQIEVWDWKAGKCVRTLTGFEGGYVTANALLPDGRLVAGDWAGNLRIGSVDNWVAAAVLRNLNGLTGVLTGLDRLVTTDADSRFKLWRNGACEVTLRGSHPSVGFYGVPLAVIGGRLIVVGGDNSLLVAE